MIQLSKTSIAFKEIEEVFQIQQKNVLNLRQSSAGARIQRLKNLQLYLLAHLDEAKKATYADFRKPDMETMLGEIYGLNGELNYTIKHLKQWLRPQRVSTPISVLGTSSYVQYEPKGTALIISPWNYPISLALKPLVSAIAAGCTAIIKPSELTPNSSTFVKQVIENCFPQEEVVVIDGGVDVSKVLLTLPFNHIFFTGSPAIGKEVMKAAAEHLTSVTLELGGKSPCIIDETADIEATVRKVAWGKFLNNGQTCIAPDYLLVHRSIKGAFIKEMSKVIKDMYDVNGEGIEASDSYCRIVNDQHFDRLNALLINAIALGAKVEIGGSTNAVQRFIEPTILTEVNDYMKIMEEEIFGPLLPILEYDNLDKVIDYINGKNKPLALYINSNNSATVGKILSSISAGDTLINELLLQFGHCGLPFGGINSSGIGKSNGFYGFQEFSNAKGVLKRRFGTMKFVYPPYTDKIRKIINWAVKYI